MRFLVAPDAFKGTLTAGDAAAAIAAGIREVLPDAEVIELPLADGGEGTAEILSPYLPDDICLIESAQLIGLNLPQMRSLDVMQRSSLPLGQAILAGLDAGKRDFVIGLGGSATNDGGLGILMALGMQAVDRSGKPVEPNLAGLLSVHTVDLSALEPRISESRMTILSDVSSPLIGNHGATAVYGPQKGLRTEDVDRVDRAIMLFAETSSLAFGSDPSRIPGAGAAGGLGFALMLLDGVLVSGARFVMNACGFASKIADVDWVITGEGCSDLQTLAGKLPLVVAKLARERGKAVAILSGSVDASALPRLTEFADYVAAAGEELPGSSAEAFEWLKASAGRFAQTLQAS